MGEANPQRGKNPPSLPCEIFEKIRNSRHFFDQSQSCRGLRGLVCSRKFVSLNRGDVSHVSQIRRQYYGPKPRTLDVHIAFTVCFAVWTIFAIIGMQIKKDLGLNETQFGLLVGTPILTGSLIRIALGIWTDQYGGRIVYTAVMLAAAVATYLLT